MRSTAGRRPWRSRSARSPGRWCRPGRRGRDRCPGMRRSAATRRTATVRDSRWLGLRGHRGPPGIEKSQSVRDYSSHAVAAERSSAQPGPRNRTRQIHAAGKGCAREIPEEITLVPQPNHPVDRRGPMIIAHRGASAAHPENTVAAFAAARAAGRRRGRAGRPAHRRRAVIVHHDDALADGRVIVELAAADLPDHVPSLAEALDACGGMVVNIEIKNWPDDADFDPTEAVADARRRAGAAHRPPRATVLVSSFHLPTVDRVRALDARHPDRVPPHPRRRPDRSGPGGGPRPRRPPPLVPVGRPPS